MNSVLTTCVPRVVYVDSHKARSQCSASESDLICQQVQDIITKLFISNGCHDLRKYSLFIAVCMPQCLELIPVVCGIVKAGFAFIYVPVDESKEFKEEILKSTPCAAVLSSPPYVTNGSIVSVGKLSNLQISILYDPSDTCFVCPPLCYAMYTSGSTGPAKIVRVPFCCVLPNIFDLQKRLSVTSRDVLFVLSPLTFDPCMVDILLAWFCRCTLVNVADQIRRDPTYLFDAIVENHVTVLFITPTVFYRFSKSQQKCLLGVESCLRVLIFGGELFPSVEYMKCVKHRENNTRIFNIYGTTEVSVWATILEVKLDSPDEGCCIGQRLSGTSLAILKDNEDIPVALPCSQHIKGELYIGGLRRKCLVGQEKNWAECPELRCTGDLVDWNCEKNEIRFLRRIDGLTVKRLGKKIDLSAIENVSLKCAHVNQAVCLFDAQSEILYLAIVVPENDCPKDIVIDSVQASLRKSVPNHCCPDHAMCTPALPVNSHGKVDKSALLRLVIDHKNAKMALPTFSNADLNSNVDCILKNYLPSFAAEGSLDKRTIKEIGMDSLRILQFITCLEEWSGKSLPLAFQKISEGAKVLDLCKYMREQVSTEQDLDFAPAVKRIRLEMDVELNYASVDGELFHNNVKIIRRGNDIERINDLSNEIKNAGLDLTVRWQWDSGKCIDASPILLTVHNSFSRAVCFICSHSGRVACLDALDGRVIWTRDLPGRLEASCALTCDGRFVVVGCYDACVYILESTNGLIVGQLVTGDCVKCTALAHPTIPSLVYYASHDNYLYCSNVQTQKIEWKVCLDAGIVSSPAFSKDNSVLFVATLGSVVFCLNCIDGSIVWRKFLPKPIFASVSCLTLEWSCVLIVPCVDGVLYCLDPSTGQVHCAFATEGPLFGQISAITVANELHIIFGSNDRILRSIKLRCSKEDSENGGPCASNNHVQLNYEFVLHWQCVLDSEMPTTPFVYVDNAFAVICCVSKLGSVYLLSLGDGSVMLKYSLPLESFSSPLVYENMIFVGCRNNFLYCLDINGSKVL